MVKPGMPKIDSHIEALCEEKGGAWTPPNTCVLKFYDDKIRRMMEHKNLHPPK